MYFWSDSQVSGESDGCIHLTSFDLSSPITFSTSDANIPGIKLDISVNIVLLPFSRFHLSQESLCTIEKFVIIPAV